MDNARVKVTIRCRICGEKFVLRGRRDNDRIETGFKQCLCDNIDQFEIEEQNW
ncbi:hypothetical protein [Paenibacillus sabuli]|uniref:hypothetical protein n=1 Tax=Paenibacillus sabuli TaxID=2772509 RepID=UPI001CC2879A|nr:hypothetical protein [Paenibacillus sabuli]